ncbi:MAG: response regulator transcription factor [Deltaproteobacteria bacterium]|nr:response regulator transcription factor [Deltaproteobacteria bacterium]
MKKILVIEDQDDLRELIVYNLKKDKNSEIIEVPNANEALIVLEDLSVDLILLDLMLPGLKGFEFLKIIKDKPRLQSIPVVILSAKSEDKDIVKGLNLGAEDYLTKPFSFQVLITKIDKILNRSQNGTSNKLIYQNIEIIPEKYEVYINGVESKLTHKEFELLMLFIRKPKQVFNRHQLLNTIWGYESDVYTRTVDSHISSLRKKLGSQSSLIKSIPKVGYGFDL